MLKIAPTQGAHFRHVETHDLGFLADTDWRDQIADLEPHESHCKREDDEDTAIDDLCHELAGITVK